MSRIEPRLDDAAPGLRAAAENRIRPSRETPGTPQPEAEGPGLLRALARLIGRTVRFGALLFVLALLAGGAVLLYWHWAQRSAVAFFNAYAANDRAALALMVDWPSVRAVAEATAPDAAANLFRDPLAGAIAGAATGLAGRRVIQSLAGPDLLALLLPSGPVPLLQGSLDGPGRLVAPMIASDGRRWHLVFELRGWHWVLIGVRLPSRPR